MSESDKKQKPAAPAAESADAEDAANDNTVGYNNPPQEHQFKRGQSGNPAGRPNGARNRKTILRELLDGEEKVSTTENGVKRDEYISRREIVYLSLFAKAAEGHVPTAKLLIDADDRYCDALDAEEERASKQSTGVTQEMLWDYERAKMNHETEIERLNKELKNAKRDNSEDGSD
ncbi:MAG: DUF5681 domain-containing protein [Pseudomonadota bacterium]